MEGEDYCGLLSIEDKEDKETGNKEENNTDEKCIATLGDGGNIAKSKKISRRPPGFSILPFPKSSLYLLNLVYNEVVIIFFDNFKKKSCLLGFCLGFRGKGFQK